MPNPNKNRNPTSHSKIRKFVALYDIHVPYNINLNGVLKFLTDFNPDEVVLGGDFWDMYPISRWSENDVRVNGFKWIVKEMKATGRAANQLLDEIQEATPRANWYYLRGNHDERMDDFSMLHPQIVNTRLRDYLQFSNRKIKWIPQWLQLGKMYFHHGDVAGGDLFTKKLVTSCHRNIRVGHRHTTQVYTTFSPLQSKETVEGKSIGCLCGKAPDYLGGAPNRWMNGFLMGYIMPNGNFNDYHINIFNDSFVAPNGKFYGPK